MALSMCNTKTNDQGRELVQHGSTLFPIACYHDDLGQESVPWHWHEEWEAAVVVKGVAMVCAGGEKQIVEEGEGFFINGGTLHGAWAVNGSACEFHSIVFHPRLVGGSMDSVFWQGYVQPLLDDESRKYVWLTNQEAWHQEVLDATEQAWQSCVAEKPGFPFQVRTALSQMVFVLTSHYDTEQKPPSEKLMRDGMRIKRMLQYIQEHMGEEISIGSIAESANISESECLRCFRSTIGTTPIQYVKQLRIQCGAELLLNTDQKIVTIAAQCGFQEISYFSKIFREIQGCTPSQYRKAYTEL